MFNPLDHKTAKLLLSCEHINSPKVNIFIQTAAQIINTTINIFQKAIKNINDFNAARKNNIFNDTRINSSNRCETDELDEGAIKDLNEYESNHSSIKGDSNSILKNFEVKFSTFDDKIKIKETTTLTKTVDLRNQELESKKNFLEKKRDKLPEGPDKDKINTWIEICDKELKDVKALGNVEFASTNSSRMIFEEHGVQAKEKSCPLLANLHNQKVFINNEVKSSVNRSAAITDFSHGETNLFDLKAVVYLKELSDALQKGVHTEFLKENGNQTLFEEINAIYHIGYSHGDDRTKVDKVLEKLQKNIAQSYGKEFTNVKEAQAQRESRLKSQFFQDLTTHLQNYDASLAQPLKDKDGKDILVVTRLALLDLTKASKGGNSEGSDFVLNERNQALDMFALYKDLKGKTLLFEEDAQGIFEDPSNPNVIHVPQHLKPENFKGQELCLRPVFLNISPCGNTKHEKEQVPINEHGLKELNEIIDLLPEEKKSAAKKLYETLSGNDSISSKKHTGLLAAGKKGSFAVADKACELLGNVGFLSIDCYGGKDRTGYMLATITARISEKVLGQTYVINSKEFKKELSALKHFLMSDESIAKKIIKLNTGHTAIKLSSLDLPLFTTMGKIKEIGKIALVMLHLTPLEGKATAAYSPLASKKVIVVKSAAEAA